MLALSQCPHIVMRWAMLAIVAAGCSSASPTPFTENDAGVEPMILAARPPMGWNSWNYFSCKADADAVRRAADAMVASGMAAAGYEYVNLDGCWQELGTPRDADGTIRPDPVKFPDGIQPIADYVHARGLKFGIYTDAGSITCNKNEGAGSFGHEDQDARTWAAWGVDYVKIDWCGGFELGLDARTQYGALSDAITRTGRPMVLSVCTGYLQSPWNWGSTVGQLWRTTLDIQPNWMSVLDNIDQTARWAAASRPGAWNDPDMLEVGNEGLTPTEARTHFGLWAITAAPLLAGNDLSSMTDETAQILTNPEVIAVDQDPLGAAGVVIAHDELGGEIWARPLAEAGQRAVALVNRGEAAATVQIAWGDLGLARAPALVRDLWAREERGSFDEGYGTTVEPHGIALLRITGSEPSPPNGETHLSDWPWRHASSRDGRILRDVSREGPLALGEVTFDKGIAAAAPASLHVHLAGQCTSFSATLGVDGSVESSESVTFEIWADRVKLFDSGTLTPGGPVVGVDVVLTGRQALQLRMLSVGESENVAWAIVGDPRLRCRP
jgi:alpha-galactosidase